MLGRVRASPMESLEILEMQRPPSKIIKHDSLSIYEATLLKLKQGSHCNPTQTTGDSAQCAMETDSLEEVETITNSADSSSTDSLTSSSCNFQPRQYEGRDVSILYMFSKYKRSRHDQSPNVRNLIPVSGSSSSSSSVSCSPTSSS
ncbi:hypothetical protein ACJIZ3_023640 [Penstemon smallii]|uniref:Uncharacterized protein n=1 Tax=Penstemon smallii TaxID=265156 RepID=A0ABD3TPM2_9LAMI